MSPREVAGMVRCSKHGSKSHLEPRLAVSVIVGCLAMMTPRLKSQKLSSCSPTATHPLPPVFSLQLTKLIKKRNKSVYRKTTVRQHSE